MWRYPWMAGLLLVGCPSGGNEGRPGPSTTAGGSATASSTADPSEPNPSTSSTTSTGSSGVDPDSTSRGTEAPGSTGEPAGFCECWDDLYGGAAKTCTVVAEPQPCTSPLECCPDDIPDGYTCLADYPYIYECTDGACVTAGCGRDSDCQAYADALGLQNGGCIESDWPCDDLPNACSVTSDPVTCTSPLECCPEFIPDTYTCLADYPYLYDCQDGICVSAQCSDDSQCQTHAEQASLPGADCVTIESDIECYELPDSPYDNSSFSICDFSGKPPSDGSCDTATDCCPPSIPAPYVCQQDYPYLYECVEGSCTSAPCDSDAQCSTYGDQSGLDLACL